MLRKLTCLLAVAIGSALWLQPTCWSQEGPPEFQGDTFKYQQIVIPPPSHGVVKLRMRDIFAHRGNPPIVGYKPVYGNPKSSIYAFWPHPVKEVPHGHMESKWVQDPSTWHALQNVGVGGGSSSSHRSSKGHHRSRKGHHRRISK